MTEPSGREECVSGPEHVRRGPWRPIEELTAAIACLIQAEWECGYAAAWHGSRAPDERERRKKWMTKVWTLVGLALTPGADR